VTRRAFHLTRPGRPRRPSGHSPARGAAFKVPSSRLSAGAQAVLDTSHDFGRRCCCWGRMQQNCSRNCTAHDTLSIGAHGETQTQPLARLTEPAARSQGESPFSLGELWRCRADSRRTSFELIEHSPCRVPATSGTHPGTRASCVA
jgi:hypothetical protein